MIEQKAYEKLMAEHGLTLADLNDEARLGIQTIKDVEKGINLLVKKGKEVGPKTIEKIRANDKWVCREILDIVEHKNSNQPPVAPHSAEAILKEAEEKAKLESDAKKKADEEAEASKKVEVDSIGVKIDSELEKLLKDGKTSITSDELKTLSPDAYDVIAKAYKEGEENGLQTDFYQLKEKETGIFELTKL